MRDLKFLTCDPLVFRVSGQLCQHIVLLIYSRALRGPFSPFQLSHFNSTSVFQALTVFQTPEHQNRLCLSPGVGPAVEPGGRVFRGAWHESSGGEANES